MRWMYWTATTAAFFAAIAVMLAAMTAWELRSPSIARRGFLPMPTTRGDRLFIGLLGAAWVHLLWAALTDVTLLGASVLAALWMAIVGWRG